MDIVGYLEQVGTQRQQGDGREARAEGRYPTVAAVLACPSVVAPWQIVIVLTTLLPYISYKSESGNRRGVSCRMCGYRGDAAAMLLSNKCEVHGRTVSLLAVREDVPLHRCAHRWAACPLLHCASSGSDP